MGVTLKVTILCDLERVLRREIFVCFDPEGVPSLGAGLTQRVCVYQMEAAACTQPAAFWMRAAALYMLRLTVIMDGFLL